jgi:hypothetical protein
VFTGIVEALGEVVEAGNRAGVHRLVVAAPVLSDGVA